MPHGPIWSVLSPHTLGKRALEVNQQENDCCSQSSDLKISIYLAFCGFISCPEMELCAADGAWDDKHFWYRFWVQHGFLCCEISLKHYRIFLYVGSGRKHNSDGLHFGFPTLDEIRWSTTLQSAFQTQGTPRVGKERGGTQGFQQPVGNRYEKYSCTGHPARRTTELPQKEPTPSSATLGHSLLLGQGALSTYL